MAVVYNVSQAAAIVGVSPSSLRNWCKQYAAHLSASASPPAGSERVLSPADVATLQHIKAQRDLLKDYDQIVAELAAMPIDVAIAPYIDVQATPQPQDSAQQPQTALQPTDVLQALQIVVDSRYSQLQGQIEALGSVQADRLRWFVYGVAVGVLLVVAAVFVVWLGWSVR